MKYMSMNRVEWHSYIVRWTWISPALHYGIKVSSSKSILNVQNTYIVIFTVLFLNLFKVQIIKERISRPFICKTNCDKMLLIIRSFTNSRPMIQAMSSVICQKTLLHVWCILMWPAIDNATAYECGKTKLWKHDERIVCLQLRTRFFMP